MKTYYYLLTALILFSCSGQGDENTENNQEALNAICIWENAALRDAPSKKAKWLASISVGETVVMLGDTAYDSTENNKEFYKVKLSDGKEGWTIANLLVPGARVTTATEKIVIYKRPDLLTATKKNFKSMEMIAVMNEEDDWLEVIGDQRKKHGWIKGGGITFDEVDVTVAILANKALLEKDSKTKQEMIKEIISNPSFEYSQFLSELRRLLDPFSVENVITVSTAEEFIEAIAPNTKIEIKGKTYNITDINLDKLPGTEMDPVYETDYVFWNNGTLSIRNIENLIISGVDNKSSKIISTLEYTPVIIFENVKNVSIKNLSAGHQPAGGKCDAAVFEFIESNDIYIDHVVLFGSGTEGLYLSDVNNFKCNFTDIRDCTYGIMYIFNSKNLQFTGGSYYDNDGYEQIIIENSSNILFSELSITNNKSASVEGALFYIVDCSNISLEDLVISNNKQAYFEDPGGYLNLGYIVFENNVFPDPDAKVYEDYEEEEYYDEDEEYYEGE